MMPSKWSRAVAEGRGAILLALLASVLWAGCDPGPGRPIDGFAGGVGGAKGRVRPARDLPNRPDPAGGASGGTRPRPPRNPEDKLHPALRAYLVPAAPDVPVTVIVSFVDGAKMPVVPADDRPEADADTALAFVGRKVTGPAFLRPLLLARAADYDTLGPSLSGRFGATGVEYFWLSRGALMTVPASSLGRLAARRDVAWLEPARTRERPPQGAGSADTAMAREEVGADALLEEGYGTGRVTLLDTGLRFDHALLAGPGRIGLRRDCVLGDGRCAGASAEPGETCPDQVGHGTASAALLAGGAALGDENRGVTNVKVDSYRIYYADGSGDLCAAFLDRAATIRALQEAVRRRARVVLVEAEGEAALHSGISFHADRAFEAGAVVIAPVGNSGAGKVGLPAEARGVIAVGAYSLKDGDWFEDQSYGPTPGDARTKPEVIAPTDVQSAWATTPEEMGEFGETSGAAPIATGLAVLLRNFIRTGFPGCEPGHVYAAMLASASSDFHGYDREKHGAGRIAFPEDGALWVGRRTIGPGEMAEVEFPEAFSGSKSVEVALWWPEKAAFDDEGYAVDTHNDVNLEIVRVRDGEEEVVASSERGPGVFERASVRITGPDDVTWLVRIRGASFAGGRQKVYWAVVGIP